MTGKQSLHNILCSMHLFYLQSLKYATSSVVSKQTNILLSCCHFYFYFSPAVLSSLSLTHEPIKNPISFMLSCLLTGLTTVCHKQMCLEVIAMALNYIHISKRTHLVNLLKGQWALLKYHSLPQHLNITTITTPHVSLLYVYTPPTPCPGLPTGEGQMDISSRAHRKEEPVIGSPLHCMYRVRALSVHFAWGPAEAVSSPAHAHTLHPAPTPTKSFQILLTDFFSELCSELISQWRKVLPARRLTRPQVLRQ